MRRRLTVTAALLLAAATGAVGLAGQEPALENGAAATTTAATAPAKPTDAARSLLRGLLR